MKKRKGLRLGDIVISIEQAARQAKEHGLSFENEIAQLILHGLLHLSGYDHETDHGEMNRLELKLRKRLGIECDWEPMREQSKGELFTKTVPTAFVYLPFTVYD